MSSAIYACDIGSTRSNRFGWARVGGPQPIVGRTIDGLVDRIVEDAESGSSVALGFESPLFMPVPTSPLDLGSGRNGEGNRSMFASAGAAVTTLGVHQSAWILRELRERVGDKLLYTMDWREWPPGPGKQLLLLWEAFVSGAAHGADHTDDALTAAKHFERHESNLESLAADVEVELSFCLVHAVALWSKWTTDVQLLGERCLVVKPVEPYRGSSLSV